MVEKCGQGIKDGRLSGIIFPNKRRELVYLNLMLILVATKIFEDDLPKNIIPLPFVLLPGRTT